MSLRFRSILWMLCLGLMGQPALAAGLKIDSFAPDIKELDLFSPKAGGAYLKTIDPATLRYPIPIIADRNGSYIIRIDGNDYVIDASGANTNKVYHAKAKGVCANSLNGEIQGSTRGITGQGC